MNLKQCKIEGCLFPRWAKGLCLYHDKIENSSKYEIKPKIRFINPTNDIERVNECNSTHQDSKSNIEYLTIEQINEKYGSHLKPKSDDISKPKNLYVTKRNKPSGELKLFLEIYAERKGICQITGEQIGFDVWCFAHVLSKGAYPSLRLYKDNIVMCKREIHELYDNRGKEEILHKYPKAILFYELKDKLKHEYYNS